VNQPTREMVEAMVHIATNGALDRIDQRGKRARELYRWGLHPHHAEAGSPLATDAFRQVIWPHRSARILAPPVSAGLFASSGGFAGS
jgi:hypothetical protein